jgi:hypothetical protein
MKSTGYLVGRDRDEGSIDGVRNTTDDLRADSYAMAMEIINESKRGSVIEENPVGDHRSIGSLTSNLFIRRSGSISTTLKKQTLAAGIQPGDGVGFLGTRH